MSVQSWCPYGLKSLMECISRATFLSQPTDITEFLHQYLSELISFRSSHPEIDPKVASFDYQDLWENNFLKNMKGTEIPIPTSLTSTASPQVPSQAEVKGALKILFSDLASSTDKIEVTSHQKQTLTKLSGKGKKPAAPPINPTPPPRVGRQFRRNAPPPFLVVKGEAKPAPPRRDVSTKTRRVSSVRVQQQSEGTTGDINKKPETRILPPILKKSPADVSVSKRSAAAKPSKLASIPVPETTEKLAIPPIPQRNTRAGQVSVVQGKGITPKPRKGTTGDIKKMPETRILPPILKKSSTPADASVSKRSAATKPSKLPCMPVLETTQRLVLPTIPQRTTRADKVSVVKGKGITPKPRQGTTDDIKKMPETRTLPPILKKSSTPADASVSKRSAATKPSKLLCIPVVETTQKRVLPTISQRTTRADQVSVVKGKGITSKPRTGSPMARQVVSGKTSSRSPVHKAVRSVKEKGKPKRTDRTPRPESIKEPETKRSKPKEPEKNRIRPNRSPDGARGQRALWIDRERVIPVLKMTVIDIFGSPASAAQGTNHTFPHPPHAVHAI